MADFSRYTAFVVDDEEVDLFITQRILKIKGLAGKVVVFRNGEELLGALNSNHVPDYVLLNYRMPGKNGLEITDLLNSFKNKLPKFPHIIITSSTAFSADIDAIKKHDGVDAFLPKPIVPAKLEEIISAKLTSL